MLLIAYCRIMPILYRLLFLIRLRECYWLHSMYDCRAFYEKKTVKGYFTNLSCCVLTVHQIGVSIWKLVFSLIKDLKLKIPYLCSPLPLCLQPVLTICWNVSSGAAEVWLQVSWRKPEVYFFILELPVPINGKSGGVCVYFPSPSLKSFWV